jgi:carbonic anhydrase/acetyltransferase-like protein (isoleucine patch superfamily)
MIGYLRQSNIHGTNFMLYAFEGKKPKILGDNFFIAESAEIIGDVVINNNVSIFPNSVIRADNQKIILGENTNIQDGAVLHTDAGLPMELAKGVTVAHQAMLHGCYVGDNTVIGIGSVVLNKVVIGKNSIVGAGAIVLEDQEFPDNVLIVGSPAKIKKYLSDVDVVKLKRFYSHYRDKIGSFNKSLQPVSVSSCKIKNASPQNDVLPVC